MGAKTYRTTTCQDGPMCFVPVPFDPKPIYGRVRAPVKATLKGDTCRSTIFAMRCQFGVPLCKSNRQAAGLEGGETLDVILERDRGERRVPAPDDLAAALQAVPALWERWQSLSVTRRRADVEAVGSAKRPGTRLRRIATVLAALGAD